MLNSNKEVYDFKFYDSMNKIVCVLSFWKSQCISSQPIPVSIHRLRRNRGLIVDYKETLDVVLECHQKTSQKLTREG